MSTPILRGSLVRLGAPNPETDAKAIAAWSRHSEFLQMLEMGAPRPWTAQSTKTEMLEMQDLEKTRDKQYPFVIRALDGDRLIGFTDLEIPNGSQRNAWLAIGIGQPEDWGRGYGTDAVRVLLRYAFAELNLDRVMLNVFAYNERAQRSYLKVGFKIEGRERERLRRGARRYDLIHMAVLRDEWQSPESP